MKSFSLFLLHRLFVYFSFFECVCFFLCPDFSFYSRSFAVVLLWIEFYSMMIMIDATKLNEKKKTEIKKGNPKPSDNLRQQHDTTAVLLVSRGLLLVAASIGTLNRRTLRLLNWHNKWFIRISKDREQEREGAKEGPNNSRYALNAKTPATPTTTMFETFKTIWPHAVTQPFCLCILYYLDRINDGT